MVRRPGSSVGLRVPEGQSGGLKQTSRDGLHRRNAESEVYDDGTNTFFWRTRRCKTLQRL
uniref:Uncharacterized protein n=1 Tax=Cyprinodon variegatus TaxID=28743 RepID=A0A3Q2CL79_CYPVA